MASFETALSGLAGEIRSSTTGDQFDLCNYTEARAKDLITSAFTTPLDAPKEMIKFTFIIGGGKLVRARYNDDLSKWLIAALRDIGYSEDRSSAETFDSQGTYKQQHDTGANLKYLIVYPRVSCSDAKKESLDSDNGKTGKGGVESCFDTKSPEYIINICELKTLTEIVAAKTQSWKQRKALLKCIQDWREKFMEVEAKLITGSPLTPLEQSLYDINCGADAEKISWLQSECKKMVDSGCLTAAEKEEVLHSIDTNIQTLSAEISLLAKEGGKAKKLEQLEERQKTLKARRDCIQKAAPIHHRLRHGDEIQKLRVRFYSLLALEDKGRSMSLTLADLKALEEKFAIEENIGSLETASRCWFSDEADFKAQCLFEEREAKARYDKLKSQLLAKNGASGAKKVGSSTTVGSKTTNTRSGTSSSSGWVMSGVAGGGAGKKISSSSSTARGGSSAPSKKSAGASGFAAAFGNNSDSD